MTTAPWTIASGPEPVRPVGSADRYRYVLRRGEEERDVFVEVSFTASATDPNTLPSPLDDAIRTRGRSMIEANLDRVEPPAVLRMHTGS